MPEKCLSDYREELDELVGNDDAGADLLTPGLDAIEFSTACDLDAAITCCAKLAENAVELPYYFATASAEVKQKASAIIREALLYTIGEVGNNMVSMCGAKLTDTGNDLEGEAKPRLEH